MYAGLVFPLSARSAAVSRGSQTFVVLCPYFSSTCATTLALTPDGLPKPTYTPIPISRNENEAIAKVWSLASRLHTYINPRRSAFHPIHSQAVCSGRGIEIKVVETATSSVLCSYITAVMVQELQKSYQHQTTRLSSAYYRQTIQGEINRYPGGPSLVFALAAQSIQEQWPSSQEGAGFNVPC
ncbi:hypothetical protein LX32DRAFT_679516 [Colletotrichum zoysiae]|uniref:Uncharacterized protein n=1 Tax=Colletotrichum zoysiae TaxID=1216348 RepID=A0AAD9HSJ4_9PEZI|nr:hypothetical protein LX32DRAFT_679516 [Colletotrichum zoysiae]